MNPKRTIIFALFFLLLVFINYDVFTSEDIDKDTEFVYEEVAVERISKSFGDADERDKIIIKTIDGKHYEIGSSYSNCLHYGYLIKVSRGQKLTLGHIESGSIMSIFRGDDNVFSILDNGQEMMDMDCVSESTEGIKWMVGFFSVFSLSFLFRFIRSNRKKSINRKEASKTTVEKNPIPPQSEQKDNSEYGGNYKK
jgi:hypothetical protein